MPVPRVLAIADDLTGALEAGARFASFGIESAVTSGAYQGREEPVVVLDTETRHASPAEAEAAVGARAAGWPSLVYKKTDSTLRGNIGPELRALHTIYGGPIAYVPAYPEMGRTVVCGHLYVDGVPLADTDFARDPLNPVRDGNLHALLDPFCDCRIFDGRVTGDVEDAARQILDSGEYRIVAGPAAIAGALAARLGSPAAVRWPSVSRCLIVNGSAHPASRAQIDAARDLRIIATADESPWRLFHRPVPPASDPLLVARETGACVRTLLADGQFDAILVFGGDTAYAILDSLGLPVLHPLGEILPGVPVSRIAGRREVLITKAGGFGAPDLLVRLKEQLRND